MKGFYVLPSYSEAIMSLPGEYGAEAAFAVIHYGATGKLPDKMSEVVRAFLMLITPILDRTAADAENCANCLNIGKNFVSRGAKRLNKEFFIRLLIISGF